MTTIERFVPQGAASLSSDAPGWDASAAASTSRSASAGTSSGPICWKCKGGGTCKAKRKRGCATTTGTTSTTPPPQGKPPSSSSSSSSSPRRECPVCSGVGHLPPKASSSEKGSQALPGVITWARKGPPDWVDSGPDAYAVRRMKSMIGGRRQADVTPERGLVGAEKGELAALGLLERACKSRATTSKNTSTDETKQKINDVAGGAVEGKTGVVIPPPPPTDKDSQHQRYYPKWVPSNPGEQLCNLVGNWRILQRVGSHRWTTDDIVTAHVASRVALGLPLPGEEAKFGAIMTTTTKCSADIKIKTKTNADKCDARNTSNCSSSIRYLDLGTGNASVLQMTIWALWKEHKELQLEAFGVEARSEAVGLARRSLSFNIGRYEEGENNDMLSSEASKSVDVIHSDFRDLAGRNSNTTERKEGADLLDSLLSSKKFDIVTGTPPYFRVDFATDSSASNASSSASPSTANHGTVVKSATIVQGGMPTSVQSAPARCEFRGGVEAYCNTASAMLSSSHGARFVVCENWLNNQRVYDGAKEAKLEIVTVLPIKGKEDKNTPLFGVYVLRHADVASGGYPSKKTEVLPPLSVRNQKGEWTTEYAEIMAYMAIPRFHKGSHE